MDNLKIFGELKIEKLVPGGHGIATAQDGRKVFLWNALPGEIITEYKINKKKKSWAEGVAQKIINPSLARIETKDDCFLSTSPWQIMNYKFELEQKLELWQESLRQEKIEFDFKNTKIKTDGKEFYYRNKMEYSLYWDNLENIIKLAFYERGKHTKKPVAGSSLEKKEIWLEAEKIVKDLNEKKEEARKYQSLILRANKDGYVSGGLLENNKPHPKFKNLEDSILGERYNYSPNGFFQINLPVYEMALQEILFWVKQKEGLKVVDLYSGVGSIGLSVAKNRELVLVESNKSAFEELERNCQNINKMARSILAKSEDVVDFITRDCVLILDPPRAGCDMKLIDKILQALPNLVIYLSCNPTTQARDLAFLKDKYKIKACSGYNFFPRTPHLETLVILETI